MIKSYGYRHQDKVKIRRKAIKKAIRDLNYDIVMKQLEEMKEETERDWQAGRIEADINFFRKRSDRYISNGEQEKEEQETDGDTRNSRDRSLIRE